MVYLFSAKPSSKSMRINYKFQLNMNLAGIFRYGIALQNVVYDKK